MPTSSDNIVLVGMRASGKTTLGRALAARLQRPFVDLDEELGRRAGRSAERVLTEDGEPAFRERERQVLAWAAGLLGHVVATGGGAVLHGRVWEDLAQTACVVYLELPAEALVARAAQRPRPPLTARPLRDEVAELLEQREPLYRRAAHITVPVDGADPILALVERLSPRADG